MDVLTDPTGGVYEFWFDAARADLVLEFIEENLTHVKGEWAGRPFLLEPWEKDLVRALFGWKRADGSRQFRKMFLFVPRKNGKTLLIAAILLALFFLDKEGGAEIYNVAADREQAAICFDVAKQMVLNSPVLQKMIGKPLRRAMLYRDATYQVLSSDAPGKHGKNPHAVGFDELHAQKSDELYEAMTTGSDARRQPLFLFATTAGLDEESLWLTEYEYAVNVRDGIYFDPEYLPILYEAGRDAEGKERDWKDEATWRIANPNYGVSVKPESIRAAAIRAQQDPSKENHFKRTRLNLRTQQESVWLPLDLWRHSSAVERFDPAKWWAFEQSLRGQTCFGGLDAATNTDLCSFTAVFPPVAERPVWAAFYRAWIPQENILERVRKFRLEFDVWSKGCTCTAGGPPLECRALLHAIPGNVIDDAWIVRLVKEFAAVHQLRELAIDRFEARQLITDLKRELGEQRVLEYPQNFIGMDSPMREFDKLLRAHKFEHAQHPLAGWSFGCLSVKQNETGQIRPVKADRRKSGKRIDPHVAGFMALGRAIVHQPATVPNIWV